MYGWDSLDLLLDEAPGSYSLCIWDAAGRRRYAYRAEELRPSASLIKLPLVLLLYDQAAAGLLDLQRQMVITPAQQVDGEGSLDQASLPAEGLALPLRRLIEHALIESDNTASNALIDLVGMQQVNLWLADCGCRQTKLQRRFMDFEAARAGRENLTTADEMCRILLHARQIRYQEVRAFMSRAIGNDKLVAGLPPGTPIAHKLGDLPGVEHDAGIIELPSGEFAVAALSSELPSAEQGKRTLAAAARLIYRLIEDQQT